MTNTFTRHWRHGFGAVLITAALSTSAYGIPVLHTTDFIANGSRTNLVDFETLPASGVGGSAPPNFTQDGVNVDQINGDGDDIWSACSSSCWFSNTSLTWYPNGGDNGWTEITRVGGIDFADVGLDLGSVVFGFNVVTYELLNNGGSVLSGEFTRPGGADSYIGFSGGGFDLIRLRGSSLPTTGVFGDGTTNALALDNIELANGDQAVPEPTTLALLGLGFVGCGLARRKKA